MTAWRIIEWSREAGRGAITSPHYPRVEFDAARADVDDFRVGEPVHVEVEGSSQQDIRVVRIWPDLPRFRRRTGERHAPALDASIRPEAEEALALAQGWNDLRVRLSDEVVRLELDDVNFEHGPEAALELAEPSYIELPMALTPKYIVLADDAARDHLATRVDMTAADIAVSIIDDEVRFYFVVARSLGFVRLRPV